MADGSTKPIEEIAPGDQVLAYDQTSGTMKATEVETVHPPRTVKQYLVIDETMKLTPSQPVLSNGNWVSAAQLYVGDPILRADGTRQIISSIRAIDDNVTVYNFATKLGNYVAYGLVFHNKPLPYEIYPCPNCP